LQIDLLDVCGRRIKPKKGYILNERVISVLP